MPQSTHDRAAELHNTAEHAHASAAAAHAKGDHLTAHELSKKALEYSAGFTPQPEGTGPIFPISSSFVASRHPVYVAPLF